MSNEAELPALTLEQTLAVLRRLGDLTEKLVLVGGQALAFWAERYASRIGITGPVNSKDIDFAEKQNAAALAAARLGGTFKIPEPFAITPSSGLVEFRDPSGHTRRIDFLAQVFGLETEEIFDMAIGVDISDADGASFLVMHPVHSLESRIANVGGLPGYQTELALNQARASILCAREYLHDRLDDGATRAVLDINERIFKFAYYNHHARIVFESHHIDPFEGVLVDGRLPDAFRTLRLPQMRDALARKRAKRP